MSAWEDREEYKEYLRSSSEVDWSRVFTYDAMYSDEPDTDWNGFRNDIKLNYPVHQYKLSKKSVRYKPKTQEKSEQREIVKHVSMKDDRMSKEQLYQVKDTELFGKIIATNSAGKKVVEIMGTGEVKLYDMNQLEKVIPYTVSIRFSAGGKSYNYLANKGDFEKNDILVVKGFDNNLAFAQVVDVDTKSELADKFIVGYKLAATQIKGENS